MSGIKNVDNLHPVEVDHDSPAGATGNILHLVRLEGGLCVYDNKMMESTMSADVHFTCTL